MSPRALPVLWVDAFADAPLGGNPAAVVMGAEALAEDELARVAGELRAPGNAFVFPAAPGSGADRRVRVFSPVREVTYSGHTTLGAVHALLDTGAVSGDRVAMQTGAGLVVFEARHEGGARWLWQTPPLASCPAFTGDLDALLSALGLPRAALAGWAKPALTNERDLLIPVAALATVRALAPDQGALAARAEAVGIRGCFTVAREAIDPGSGTHSRFFAPHYGVPEDIITGSAHAALGVWLAEAGLLGSGSGVVRWTAEQGDSMGRPGRMAIEVALSAGRATAVSTGGRAVTVLRGTFHLP
jgi:PhzF family phenazine biosynthesis protein